LIDSQDRGTTLAYLNRANRYIVDSIQIVASKNIEVLEPTAGRRDLTLVTCFPFYFVGPAPKRFIVRAREVDSLMREPIKTVDGIIQELPK
jgi:sortase A